jgi:DNA polymerase III alpha subunit
LAQPQRLQYLYPFRLIVLPHNASGWGNLCEFITAARQSGNALEKGSYRVALGESNFSMPADCEIIVWPLPGAIDIEALCIHCKGIPTDCRQKFRPHRQRVGTDALFALAGHRRQQVWQASAIKAVPVLLKSVPTHEAALALPETPEGENIVFDCLATGLTLRRHPLALLRERLAAKGLLTAADLDELPDGKAVAACGIVTVRQQPQNAKGTVFYNPGGRSRASQCDRLEVAVRNPARRSAVCAIAGGLLRLAAQ